MIYLWIGIGLIVGAIGAFLFFMYHFKGFVRQIAGLMGITGEGKEALAEGLSTLNLLLKVYSY